MNFRAWLWQLSALTLLSLSQAKRPVGIGINNVNCVSLAPSMINEFTCVFNKQRNEPSFSSRFNLSKPLNQFTVLVDFSIVKRDNTKISVIQTKIDGCKKLSTASLNDFYGRIISAARNLGNLPKKCPILANTLYEVRNYTITLENMPVMLSALTYRCRLKILTMNEPLAEITVETTANN